ncbi:MAG TPA: hypothetical protein VN580_03225 [Clostridia bacterium]|nr:hypothetical protein [Clostridia bacterium]
MEKDLIVVLEELSKKISKAYSDKKKEKFEKQITGLISIYKDMEIPEVHVETYESLINKGRELMKESNVKQEKKVDYYLRYCGAALYDFKDNLQPLNIIMKSFLLTAALFFVLAPQYFSFILPLIFAVPVFMGLRGIRKRVLNGLIIGVAIVPMAILVAMVWIRNAVLTVSTGTFGSFVNQLAQSYGFSFEFSKNLAIACIMLSIVMLASAVTLIYNAVKHRSMFI